MFDKIVVLLNGLPSAETAIAPAAEIALAHHAELHLVIVDSMTRLDPMSEEFAEVDGATYHDRNLRLLAESLQADRGIRVLTARLSGAVVDAIVGYVAGMGADLVVIATRGRTGWRRAFAGSVADDLLHALTERLLLVRIDEAGAPPVTPFARILVGLDGSTVAERGLDGARAMAQAGKSTLLLARVVEQQEMVHDARAYLDRLADDVRRDDRLNVETMVRVATGIPARLAAARALAAIVRDEEIDLVSLTTRNRGTSRLLLRSVADTLLRKTRSALLLCGPQDSRVAVGPPRQVAEHATAA